MDKKLALAMAIWVSGFVAGILLVTRWRQEGTRQLETTTTASGAEASPAATRPGKVQRLAGPIAAGARADLLRVRNAANSVNQLVTSTVRGQPQRA